MRPLNYGFSDSANAIFSFREIEESFRRSSRERDLDELAKFSGVLTTLEGANDC